MYLKLCTDTARLCQEFRYESRIKHLCQQYKLTCMFYVTFYMPHAARLPRGESDFVLSPKEVHVVSLFSVLRGEASPTKQPRRIRTQLYI